MKKPSSSLLVTLICGLSAVSSHAITMYGLGTNGALYSFDTAAPGTFVEIGTPANGITDIDFRGSNGNLYGITGTGSTFTVNLLTGAATSAFTPATTLNGMVSGFDVNPAADRFRVVTDAAAGNNNYRLSSPGGDTDTTTADGTFGTPSGVSILDVAYTNPFGQGVGGTSLYSIGSDGNLYVHSDGPGFNTMTSSGSLGFTPLADIAFDIAQDGTGYIANGTDLYSVSNIGTSVPNVTLLGTLGQPLSSFSAVPEPSSALLACFAGLGLLRRRR